MRWERDHFAEQATRSRADVIVDGAPTLPHDPETELVATRGATLPTSTARIKQ